MYACEYAQIHLHIITVGNSVTLFDLMLKAVLDTLTANCCDDHRWRRVSSESCRRGLVGVGGDVCSIELGPVCVTVGSKKAT